MISSYPVEEKWHELNTENRDEIKGMSWYTKNFSIEITGFEKRFKEEAVVGKFIEIGNAIAKLFDWDDIPDKPEYGEYFIFGSARIMSEQIGELTEYLNKLRGLSKAHEFGFKLETSFATAISEN